MATAIEGEAVRCPVKGLLAANALMPIPEAAEMRGGRHATGHGLRVADGSSAS